MPGLAGILHALEIRVFANIGDALQRFREGLALRPGERARENGAMLGLRTSAVRRGLLAQALNDTVIHVTHQ
ncbi:hypothetical protein WI42_21480 [Burkholderia ubonensis]|nr:hypothetical protein WI40_11025 [Burkholderia ubonensis]KVA13846.1 hypothetical protein WI42_21480 [Burkholderia ubonensis]